MRRAAFRIFPRQTLSARARPPHTGAPHPQPAAMRRRISFGESVAICRGLLYTGWCCGAAGRARGAKAHTERYRSGHNGGASKALWEQSHVGSNPTLSAKAEGPCSAWALCFAFGQVGFEGRNRKCRSAVFSRPGSLAPPRWSPVPGASPRPGESGRGNRSGQRADAPRERRGERERQRLAPKHPFHPLQIRSASRVTSFQASPANRRGSRPPRSPR